MKNYTTQTAALKATTVDTRLLDAKQIDAKQIDTKKLFINGTQFDPSQIKESPNQIMLMLAVLVSFMDSNQPKLFAFMNEDGEEILSGDFENNKVQFDLSELLSILYPDRNTANEINTSLNFLGSNFFILHYDTNSDGIVEGGSIEPCILDLHCQEEISEENSDNFQLEVTIKLGEEDDKLEELYGGYTQNVPSYFAGTMFYMSIPYATPLTQSSTFSLRQPQVSPLSLEKTRQIFEQMLDKSAE